MCMGYIKGVGRNQARIVTLGSMVAADSPARLVDAFVDSLDMAALGFAPPAAEGRPAYDPRSVLKLYVLGYRKGVRSSRRLAAACRENLEAMWLVSGVEPDFRTVSDFRKGHAGSLREVFHEFNRRLSGAVSWGFCSVDGSKFAASNSRMRNFTAHKLDDRIAWLDGHVEECLRRLDAIDSMGEPGEDDLLTRDVVEAKLAEARERLARYESCRALMERDGLSQLSLTDADARLMRSKNGFAVAYNPQTAVDSETHLIRDLRVTNAPTDHGQLLPTMSRVAEEDGGVVEVTADKGYQSADDIAACLEAGILPHVIADDGVDAYEIELPHEPADDADPTSGDPSEISRCLRAGVVPDAYAGSRERRGQAGQAQGRGRGAGPVRALRDARGDGCPRRRGLLRARPHPQPGRVPRRRDAAPEVGEEVRRRALREQDGVPPLPAPRPLPRGQAGLQGGRLHQGPAGEAVPALARCRGHHAGQVGRRQVEVPLRDLGGRRPHARAGRQEGRAQDGHIRAPVRHDQARDGDGPLPAARPGEGRGRVLAHVPGLQHRASDQPAGLREADGPDGGGVLPRIFLAALHSWYIPTGLASGGRAPAAGIANCRNLVFGRSGGYSYPFVEHNQSISEEEIARAWSFFEDSRNADSKERSNLTSGGKNGSKRTIQELHKETAGYCAIDICISRVEPVSPDYRFVRANQAWQSSCIQTSQTRNE